MSNKEKGMDIDKEVKSEEIKSDDAAIVGSMFEQDGLEVPDSLSRENIASMLEEADAKKNDQEAAEAVADTGNGSAAEPVIISKESKPEKKTVKKHSWSKVLGWAAAIAACFLLVAVPAVRLGRGTVPGAEGEKGAIIEESGEDGAAGSLMTFTSYDEIFSLIDEISENYGYRKYRSGDMVLYEDSAEAIEGDGSIVHKNSLGAAPKASAGSIKGEASFSQNESDGEEHSDTYIQVEGVDEADRLKVDGKYIYFIDSSRSRVLIYQANNGKPVKVSTIKTSDEESVQDIFLNGDRLVVISDQYNFSDEGATSVRVYDVSDRSRPKKTAEYIQSGTPVSQRMVGNILYLVTDQDAYNKVIPYCGGVKNNEKIKAKDISCLPNPANAEYTVIGAIDTASGKELSHVTKAVLGGSQDIYSNGSNLYVAGTTYIKDKKPENGEVYRVYPYFYGRPATMVIKVLMANGKIKITDSAVVDGTIDDQFSMDERNGKFRIATTSVSDDGEEVNNLFVLDRDMNELGHVSGFAKGESIKAVRYVKDKAYVITYEQTDPLFIIDLKNSKEPKIEGEVKIDGFSTLLVPLSEDRLLGIGYGTKQVESWQETSGLKFALFDISNPSKPSVITSKTMDGIFSEVQDDHRALVQLGDGEKAKFILPCWKEVDNYAVDYEDAEAYEEYIDNSPRGGVLTMAATDDRIDMVSYDEVKEAVERCPVIGDFIYAVTDTDDVVAIRTAK